MAKRRQRRTNETLFLDKLLELGGDTIRVNNQTLRGELGWDPDKYNTMKNRLLELDKIATEPGGAGGAIRLASEDDDEAEEGDAVNVFISYCHSDSGVKSKLVKHIKPLEHDYLLKCWDDGLITAGDEWDKVISERIEEADIILLLISVDFINSKYCMGKEMKRALERHVDKEAVVIPILVRDCYWKPMPFAKLQGLPSEMRAIASWPSEDAAYLDIVTKIGELLEAMTE